MSGRAPASHLNAVLCVSTNTGTWHHYSPLACDVHIIPPSSFLFQENVNLKNWFAPLQAPHLQPSSSFAGISAARLPRAHRESISALGERDTCFCTTCIFADKRGHNGLPECIMRILKAQSSGVYTKCCTCLHPGLLPDNKRSKEIAAKKQAVPCDEPAE